MRHRATATFWKHYGVLPEEVRYLADKSFSLLKRDLAHPSVRLKKVGEAWSARVGANYRALAIDDDGGLTWIWIGTHAEYDRLLR